MSETCHRCHAEMNADSKVLIKGREIYVCQNCADDKYTVCAVCGQFVCDEDTVFADSENVCVWCAAEKYILCPHCEQFISMDEAIEFHGHFMCKSCRKRYFQKCDFCHQSFEKNDLEEICERGRILKICPSCSNGKYIFCDECHELVPVSTVLTLNEKSYCTACAEGYISQCSSCRKFVESDKIEYITVDGKTLEVCPECLEKKYGECGICGDIFCKEELYSIKSGLYCRKCLKGILDEMSAKERRNALNTLGSMAVGLYAGNFLAQKIFGTDEPDSVSPVLNGGNSSDDYLGDGLDGRDD